VTDPHRLASEPFASPSLGALFTRDARRLILHALLIVAAAVAPAMVRVTVGWHAILFEHLNQQIPITVVLSDPESEADHEALRSALAEEPAVTILQEFGPETARERLIAAGVAVESLDSAALRDQPTGFTFHWHGPPAETWALRSYLESLTREHGVEAHLDRALLQAVESWGKGAVGVDLILRITTVAAACLLLLIAAFLMGAPRLGVALSRTEMLQAIALRSFASAVIGWLLLGGLLTLINVFPGWIGVTAIWLRLLWIVPVAVVVSPLGMLRRAD
jgi:hypothetical protein